MVDMLLSLLGRSLEARDADGCSLLHQLCAAQSAETAQWLALRGADVNALNNVSEHCLLDLISFSLFYNVFAGNVCLLQEGRTPVMLLAAASDRDKLIAAGKQYRQDRTLASLYSDDIMDKLMLMQAAARNS